MQNAPMKRKETKCDNADTDSVKHSLLKFVLGARVVSANFFAIEGFIKQFQN